MWIQWLLRIAGYALTAGAPLAASKWGADVGAPIGAFGGMLLHAATPTVVPKRPIP